MQTATTNVRKFGAGAAGVLFTALVSISGFAAPAAHATGAPGPFACEPGFYQVVSGQLKLLNPATREYADIGAVHADQYNAIAVNAADGYIYGLGSTGATQAHLLKVANDGSVTDLGLPTGLAVRGYFTGDFDSDGNLVVRSTETSEYYSINVSTNVATRVAVTSGSASGSDAVFIGGILYSVDDTTLYAFDPDTGAVETKTITFPTAPSGTTFGAAWTDSDENLYVGNNTSGKIYKVNGYDGASPSAVEMLTGPTIAGGHYNDGAACKAATAPFDPPTASPDSYEARAGQPLVVAVADGILDNDNGSQLVLDSVTVQPGHGTVVVNANGSFTYTPAAGFSGDDSFKYKAKDQWGRVTGEVTVTLVVRPSAVNDAYIFQSDGTALTTDDGDGVLGNDIGTNITVISNTLAGHGTVTVAPDGALTYEPVAGYNGTDTFTYTIRDGRNRTATATVTINVTTDDDAEPSVQGTSVSASSGGSLAVTGGSVQTFSLLGLVSMVAGAALVFFTRRRSTV